MEWTSRLPITPGHYLRANMPTKYTQNCIIIVHDGELCFGGYCNRKINKYRVGRCTMWFGPIPPVPDMDSSDKETKT